MRGEGACVKLVCKLLSKRDRIKVAVFVEHYVFKSLLPCGEACRKPCSGIGLALNDTVCIHVVEIGRCGDLIYLVGKHRTVADQLIDLSLTCAKVYAVGFGNRIWRPRGHPARLIVSNIKFKLYVVVSFLYRFIENNRYVTAVFLVFSGITFTAILKHFAVSCYFDIRHNHNILVKIFPITIVYAPEHKGVKNTVYISIYISGVYHGMTIIQNFGFAFELGIRTTVIYIYKITCIKDRGVSCNVLVNIA